MVTTSAVATVRDALVALLVADSDLSGISVTRNQPQGAFLRECIWFWGATLAHEYPVIRAGRKPREETGRLRFAINAAKNGQTGNAAEDRALVLLGNVEDAIANDPTLGGVVSWIGVAQFDVGVTPQFEGWDGLITGELEYHARLT